MSGKPIVFASVDQARRRARDRLPPSVYHFLQGGKEGEATALANELAFQRVLFNPPACSTTVAPNVETSIFGQRISMPVIIAPTGLVRLAHGDGELGAARAAKRTGIPIAISMMCGTPLASVAATNPNTWFQLYMIGGRAGAEGAMQRARDAVCDTLIVTVDFAGFAPSDREARPLPQRMDLANAIAFLPEVWNRPGWLLSFLGGGLEISIPNAPRLANGRPFTLSDAAEGLLASLPSWDDLDWIRSLWKGKLIIKGIVRVEDARRAVALGADGIVVSNHGAKMLDGGPASLTVLPAIADAVGAQTTILLDGGVRRGADVVRACAMGAKAVLIGRPYLWGLAAGGENGVHAILELFRRGISATLAQLDRASFAALDSTCLHPLPEFHAWNEVGPHPLERRP